MSLNSISQAALACAFLPCLAVAQSRKSEHGTASQQVGSTTISVEYDRPGVRGRTLFGDGKVVHWGEVWTPGANWATTIEADRDVRIEGRPLPKGKYSMWLIPQPSPAPWTLMFARTARRFHTRLPPAEDEQLRVPVRPEQGTHMESLAWYFPVVTPEGATLRMHWGTTVVPIQIGVETSRPDPVSEERRTPYVGSYRMRITPGSGRPPYDVDLVVADVNGFLELRTSPADAFGDGKVDLVPVLDHRFHLASTQLARLRGQAFTTPGMLLVFEVADGRAQSVELLGYDNSVAGRGQRVR